MLVWHKELWLIDHGASLYFHHNWDSWEVQAPKPFALIQNHVLFQQKLDFQSASAAIKELLTLEVIDQIVDLIPAVWLDRRRQTKLPRAYGDRSIPDLFKPEWNCWIFL